MTDNDTHFLWTTISVTFIHVTFIHKRYIYSQAPSGIVASLSLVLYKCIYTRERMKHKPKAKKHSIKFSMKNRDSQELFTKVAVIIKCQLFEMKAPFAQMQSFQLHFLYEMEEVPGLVCPMQKPVALWRSTRHRHTSIHRVKTSLKIQISGAEALMVNPESLITTPCLDVLLVGWSMWAWSWELLCGKAWGELPAGPQMGTPAPPL